MTSGLNIKPTGGPTLDFSGKETLQPFFRQPLRK